MQFFTFHNYQSGQFFDWLRKVDDGEENDSTLVRLYGRDSFFDNLILAAQDMAARDEESAVNFDTSGHVSDCLAGLLESYLCKASNLYPFDEGEGEPLHELREIRELVADDMSLFDGFLLDSLSQIHFRSVAEAILRLKGKWAPEKHRPEAL